MYNYSGVYMMKVMMLMLHQTSIRIDERVLYDTHWQHGRKLISY